MSQEWCQAPGQRWAHPLQDGGRECRTGQATSCRFPLDTDTSAETPGENDRRERTPGSGCNAGSCMLEWGSGVGWKPRGGGAGHRVRGEGPETRPAWGSAVQCFEILCWGPGEEGRGTLQEPRYSRSGLETHLSGCGLHRGGQGALGASEANATCLGAGPPQAVLRSPKATTSDSRATGSHGPVRVRGCACAWGLNPGPTHAANVP